MKGSYLVKFYATWRSLIRSIVLNLFDISVSKMRFFFYNENFLVFSKECRQMRISW